jgi:N-acetylmuramoyl-L-alanine amidase
MPACLMELGFITTPDEEQFMNSEQALNLYTQGFFNAFMAYKKRYNENITIPYEPDNTPVIEVPQVVPPTLEEPQPEPIPQVVPMKPAQPEPQPENVKPEQPAETKPVAEETAGMPVFKVQVTANSTKLKLDAPQFQGLEQVDYYQDGGMYKYTVGASTDYNAISQLRKQLLDRFPQAFVIAFKNGKRCDVQQAIQEFKQNRKKR